MASRLVIAFDLPAVKEARALFDHCTTYPGSPFRQLATEPFGVIERVFVETPQRSDDYLRLLGCLVKVNLWSLQQWTFPPLYKSGIRYAEEPPGQEIWQSIPALYASRRGDCEDLATARVALLRHGGERAWIKQIVTGRSASGGRLFHYQVRLGDGTIEDPSRVLGML